VLPERRVVLGIAGMPGAGKSTLAAALVGALNSAVPPDAAAALVGALDSDPLADAAAAPMPAPAEWAALLPMDGFHYPPARLLQLGLRDRMGAPETFDVTAYALTIQRLTRDDQPLAAPSFDRTIEEPIPGGVRIERHHRLVITEGNYLLLPDEPWARVRAQLAQVWYVHLDEPTRVQRLVARHVRFGKTPAAAAAWVARSDEANARLVGRHAGRADLVIEQA